ncbi:hypothetical protein J6590_021646 [Homalodisca vitripennis]|nr:hypothetical protein J6590_021646 [Homalodisca vitripennis]
MLQVREIREVREKSGKNKQDWKSGKCQGIRSQVREKSGNFDVVQACRRPLFSLNTAFFHPLIAKNPGDCVEKSQGKMKNLVWKSGKIVPTSVHLALQHKPCKSYLKDQVTPKAHFLTERGTGKVRYKQVHDDGVYRGRSSIDRATLIDGLNMQRVISPRRLYRQKYTDLYTAVQLLIESWYWIVYGIYGRVVETGKVRYKQVHDDGVYRGRSSIDRATLIDGLNMQRVISPRRLYRQKYTDLYTAVQLLIESWYWMVYGIYGRVVETGKVRYKQVHDDGVYRGRSSIDRATLIDGLNMQRVISPRRLYRQKYTDLYTAVQLLIESWYWIVYGIYGRVVETGKVRYKQVHDDGVYRGRSSIDRATLIDGLNMQRVISPRRLYRQKYTDLYTAVQLDRILVLDCIRVVETGKVRYKQVHDDGVYRGRSSIDRATLIDGLNMQRVISPRRLYRQKYTDLYTAVQLLIESWYWIVYGIYGRVVETGKRVISPRRLYRQKYTDLYTAVQLLIESWYWMVYGIYGRVVETGKVRYKQVHDDGVYRGRSSIDRATLIDGLNMQRVISPRRLYRQKYTDLYTAVQLLIESWYWIVYGIYGRVVETGKVRYKQVHDDGVYRGRSSIDRATLIDGLNMQRVISPRRLYRQKYTDLYTAVQLLIESWYWMVYKFRKYRAKVDSMVSLSAKYALNRGDKTSHKERVLTEIKDLATFPNVKKRFGKIANDASTYGMASV